MRNDLYHGSNRTRGNKILTTREFVPSRGNNHWLGDGAYFFVERFYSYKWIFDMHNKRFKGKESNYKNLIKHYIILKATLNVKPDRIFDLTKAEHKVLFDLTLHKIKRKTNIPNNQMPEGVVLNYMFEKMGYKEKFDLVKALFTLNQKHYSFKNRLGYMPQEQICIKNQDVIQDIEEYIFQNEVENFEYIMHNMYYNEIKETTVIYNASLKGKKTYYKKPFTE